MLIDRESMLCRAKEKRQKIDRKNNVRQKTLKIKVLIHNMMVFNYQHSSVN